MRLKSLGDVLHSMSNRHHSDCAASHTDSMAYPGYFTRMTCKLIVALMLPWLALALALWIRRMLVGDFVGFDIANCLKATASNYNCAEDFFSFILFAPLALAFISGEYGGVTLGFFIAGYPIFWMLAFVGLEIVFPFLKKRLSRSQIN